MIQYYGVTEICTRETFRHMIHLNSWPVCTFGDFAIRAKSKPATAAAQGRVSIHPNSAHDTCVHIHATLATLSQEVTRCMVMFIFIGQQYGRIYYESAHGFPTGDIPTCMYETTFNKHRIWIKS